MLSSTFFENALSRSIRSTDPDLTERVERVRAFSCERDYSEWLFIPISRALPKSLATECLSVSLTFWLYYIIQSKKSQEVLNIFVKRFYFTYTRLCVGERLFSFVLLTSLTLYHGLSGLSRPFLRFSQFNPRKSQSVRRRCVRNACELPPLPSKCWTHWNSANPW